MDTKLTSTQTLKAIAVATALALGSAAHAQDEGQIGAQQEAQPGAQQQGAQQPGAEQPGAEQPGAERPGAEQPGAERPGAEPSVGASQQDAQQDAQQQQSAQQDSQQQSQDLQQLTQEHDNLSNFVQALEETGLADSIMQEGQSYTAFAPTDEAIEQYGGWEELQQEGNQEQLVEFLRDHLIADEVDSERAGQLGQALTVSGATLSLEQQDGELTVNGTRVADTDIRAGGLIVHTIEDVLEPTGQAAVAQQDQAGQQQDQAGQQQDQAGQQQDQAGSQQQGQAGQYPAFEEVDADSDGEVSRTELAMIEGLQFSDVDSDQDGTVNREEYMQATEEGQAQGPGAAQEEDDGGGLFGDDTEAETETDTTAEDDGGGLFGGDEDEAGAEEEDDGGLFN